jgi:ABC-type branched-subunit amino acid transport system ATPase component
MFSLRHLRKSFGGIVALDDVNLSIPDKAITAIVGPNGAGKTTLVNIMSGYLRPDGGSCLFGTRDVTHLPPYKIARLGVARSFQSLRLIQEVSVLDNMLLAGQGQCRDSLFRAISRIGVAAQEQANRIGAHEMLVSIGIDHRSGYLAADLSYGQQKILALGCCLASGGRALLLDEPVAGVDPATKSQIATLLQAIAASEKMVLLIEHDLDFVQQVANYIVVMDAGKVVDFGTSAQVFARSVVNEVYLG